MAHRLFVRTLLIIGLLVATAMTAISCSSLASPAAPTSPGSTSVSMAAELAFCSEETNRYRASVGLSPLTRSEALEDFAAKAAEHDAHVRVAHQLFAMTNGAGVSQAETEVLWWKGYATQSVVQKGLAQMWRVGPGGEHYEIMAGPYSQIGCGIFIENGEVTVTQDFR